MRMPLLFFSVIGLMSFAGGCDSSPGPVSPTSPKAIAGPPPVIVAERTLAQHEVTLEFQITDQSSQEQVENASVEMIYAYQREFNAIRSTRTDAGIWRLVYEGRYFRDQQLPPEADFLRDLWLVVTAPGYETFKVSLKKFVGERRPIDRVPWVKSPPLVVSLRKGQPKTPRLAFFAGRYRGDSMSQFVLNIYGDDTFSVYLQDQHSQVRAGFGFAEIADGKLKLRYEEKGRLEGHPGMAPILAEINSLLREYSAEIAK